MIAPSELWMIREDVLTTMNARIAAQATPQLAAGPSSRDGSMGPPDMPPRGRPSATMSDGVCVIPVCGPIHCSDTYYNWMMSYLYGGVSCDQIASAIDAATADPACKAILYRISTPGGEASGIPPLAAKMRQASTVKPSLAYAVGSATSAGYYLGSACGEFWAAPGTLLGSIGVVWNMVDDTELQAKLGVKAMPIRSSQSPKKWPDVTTEDGRAEFQFIVDSQCDQFLADVAKYRGVSVATVTSDFGQGGCMMPKQALSAGMIDRIGSIDDALKKLSGPNRARLSAARPATSSLRASLTTNQETGHVRLVFPR